MPISSIDGLIVRPSGPWIEKKYFYLRRYADILTRGMGKKWKSGGLTYIDLFAGPGRCLVGSRGEECEGSPLLSLNYEFSKYIFVERDPVSLDALRVRCRKSPKYPQIDFILGDCNAVVEKIRPIGLSLAFIDPTGVDIRFDTLKTLTWNRQVDLLLNVQFGMDIKRNFKHYVRKTAAAKLDLFLGGSVDWQSLNTPRDAIALYKNRLSEKLGYSIAQFKDILVRNMKNVPMYFLVFASKHPRGLDFWKKITSKDETGQLEMPFHSL